MRQYDKNGKGKSHAHISPSNKGTNLDGLDALGVSGESAHREREERERVAPTRE
jgi:hypothetical protein